MLINFNLLMKRLWSVRYALRGKVRGKFLGRKG